MKRELTVNEAYDLLRSWTATLARKVAQMQPHGLADVQGALDEVNGAARLLGQALGAASKPGERPRRPLGFLSKLRRWPSNDCGPGTGP